MVQIIFNALVNFFIHTLIFHSGIYGVLEDPYSLNLYKFLPQSDIRYELKTKFILLLCCGISFQFDSIVGQYELDSI